MLSAFICTLKYSSFQAAEQGSEIVVKQVGVALNISTLSFFNPDFWSPEFHFFFDHDFCFPGCFKAEFCFSHSFTLSKQVELKIKILISQLQKWSKIFCPHAEFDPIFFQAGTFNCFISNGFEKEPLTVAKTRLAFIGCYCQLVGLWPRRVNPNFGHFPQILDIFAQKCGSLFNWSVNWSTGGGLAPICDINLCLLNLRGNLLLKYRKVYQQSSFIVGYQNLLDLE